MKKYLTDEIIESPLKKENTQATTQTGTKIRN